MPGDTNPIEELQTVAALKKELKKTKYQGLGETIEIAQAELESAETGFETAQNNLAANATPQTQRAAVEAQTLLQTKQNTLKKLQESQAAKKTMEDRLQSLENQYRAAAGLEAIYGKSSGSSLQVGLNVDSPNFLANEAEFQELVKKWKGKAKENKVGGRSPINWLNARDPVKFSRQPFSVTASDSGDRNAAVVGATALLMAQDCGVKSFSIKEGTPSQRDVVAQQLLRAGYSDVELSSDSYFRKKSSIASDKTWNAIFETKKTLESKGTAKDDFLALYTALGDKKDTEHYSSASLQKKLVGSLSPKQFAEMLENEANPTKQEKMLEQLTESLKGKPASEWKKYLDAIELNDGKQLFAKQAAKQLNEQFVPENGKQTWFQQASAKANKGMINSLKDVFATVAGDAFMAALNDNLKKLVSTTPAAAVAATTTSPPARVLSSDGVDEVGDDSPLTTSPADSDDDAEHAAHTI